MSSVLWGFKINIFGGLRKHNGQALFGQKGVVLGIEYQCRALDIRQPIDRTVGRVIGLSAVITMDRRRVNIIEVHQGVNRPHGMEFQRFGKLSLLAAVFFF